MDIIICVAVSTGFRFQHQLFISFFLRTKDVNEIQNFEDRNWMFCYPTKHWQQYIPELGKGKGLFFNFFSEQHVTRCFLFQFDEAYVHRNNWTLPVITSFEDSFSLFFEKEEVLLRNAFSF